LKIDRQPSFKESKQAGSSLTIVPGSATFGVPAFYVPAFDVPAELMLWENLPEK
jgi:hypothetical protein